MKSLFGIFLVTITLLMILPGTLSAQQAGETHQVRQGETLFSISRQYDVSVGDLRRWNQLQSDELRLGQELLVGPPLREGAVMHEVQAGETLFAISRQYNVTIAELQAWNGLDDINLSLGQELVVYPTEPREQTVETAPPVEEEAPEDRRSVVQPRDSDTSNTYYTVRAGDTIIGIARQHGMTPAELRALNDLSGDIISIGQVLTVREIQSAPSIAETAEDSTPQGRFALYRVQRGESWSDVLQAHQMSEDELLALNPGLTTTSISAGQQVTVLLPPTRTASNPYKAGASMENLGEVPVLRYRDSDAASPTTSGELYNPDELTAAHPNMALGNVIFIENPQTGLGVYVRINDRHSGNGLKLSRRAFEALNFSSAENALVAIYLDP